MDLDEVAEELYALPPEEFTAARDAAAKRAPDPDIRKAVKALRRPTAAAHVVNLLVREQPDAVDDLLDLGEELRAAMSGGGGDVRDLTERRRALVSALVAPDLPPGVRDDVTATLEAATADPQLAAAVRTGRLVKPLRYAGFGELPDLADSVATAPGVARARKKATANKATAKKTPAKEPTAKEPTEKVAPDLAPMRQRVLELAGAADDAQHRFDEASRAAVQARAALESAEAERAAAHKAARTAHAEVERARRELGRLERS